MPADQGFEEIILPHFNAALRLARSFTRNDHDAEDIVQDAAVRALRYFRTFTGGNARAWFLTIVRNTCSRWHGRRARTTLEPFDEEAHESAAEPASDPETLLLQTVETEAICRAIDRLPPRLRTVLILRELEELSYREVAAAMDVPIGTVMSSLSRARRRLRELLREASESEAADSTDRHRMVHNKSFLSGESGQACATAPDRYQ